MKENTSKFEFISEVAQYANIIRSEKSTHTQLTYFSSIDRFLEFFKVSSFEDIVNISIDQCDQYKMHLLSSLQARSVNTHLRNIKAFFSYLEDRKKILSSVWSNVGFIKEPKKQRLLFTKEEINNIMEACHDVEDKLIFILLINLGPRRSELVNLKVSHIRFSEDGVTIGITGKGNKYREVFAQGKTVSLLKEHLKSRKYDSEYLFLSNRGKPYSTEAIRLKIKSFARWAGIDEERIKGLTPHSCRRTMAVHLLDEGVDAYVVKGALGHESLNTTLLYLQHTSQSTKNAMKNHSML